VGEISDHGTEGVADVNKLIVVEDIVQLVHMVDDHQIDGVEMLLRIELKEGVNQHLLKEEVLL